eukprot:758404-Hanusia_phi.AAC.2
MLAHQTTTTHFTEPEIKSNNVQINIWLKYAPNKEPTEKQNNGTWTEDAAESLRKHFMFEKQMTGPARAAADDPGGADEARDWQATHKPNFLKLPTLPGCGGDAGHSLALARSTVPGSTRVRWQRSDAMMTVP